MGGAVESNLGSRWETWGECVRPVGGLDAIVHLDDVARRASVASLYHLFTRRPRWSSIYISFKLPTNRVVKTGTALGLDPNVRMKMKNSGWLFHRFEGDEGGMSLGRNHSGKNGFR